MEPIVAKKRKTTERACNRCKLIKSSENFISTSSWAFDGYCPICNDCINEILKDSGFHWGRIDKVCQTLDIPFIPMKWKEIFDINGDNAFPIYAKVVQESEYEGLSWGDYFERYKELVELDMIEDELPLIREENFDRLREKWGSNYDEENLTYLENLYTGLTTTQNVNGALQIDQARKLCKISLTIEDRIRSDMDFDKLLSSYDKLVKTAGFSNKDTNDINDISSFGEAFRYYEKMGWINEYYDGVSRDIVDEVIKNLQGFNQRLYTGESGIGEEITSRIEALKTAQVLEENLYDIKSEYDSDEYAQEGYEDLVKEEFQLDIEGDEADITMKV